MALPYPVPTPPLQWVNIPFVIERTAAGYSVQQVTDLATQVEGDIIAKLDLNGLDTNPDPARNITGSGVGMLISAATYWTMREVRIQQKHDKTIPNSVREGNMSLEVSIDKSIEHYDTLGQEYLTEYLRALTGDEIDTSDQYAGGLFLAGEGF